MIFEEVKAFLESETGKSEEVSTYLQKLQPLSVAAVQDYLDKMPEGKSWLDSAKDKHLQKGIETWKSNNLQNLLDTEIKKRFPEKDEKELEVDKLRTEIEQMKHEKLKETLTNKAFKIATEKNLPLELVDFFIGQNEDETMQNIGVLENIYNTSVQKTLELRLKGDGYVPPKDNSNMSSKLDDLSMDEYIKLRNQNNN